MTTATPETTPVAARLHDELAKLRQADEELRARHKEAWEAYCERVDALLDEARQELGPEGAGGVLAGAAHDVLDAYRARLDDARVQLHLGAMEAQERAAVLLSTLRARLPM